MKLLVSAGEASSDRYAAQVVEAMRQKWPGAEFFGCAGPLLRAAGVRPVLRSEQLSIVGVFEVLFHIPRVLGYLSRMRRAAKAERPDLAILTDSPGFHIPLAKKLHRLDVPIVYLVAPQVWAWRPWRVRALRRVVSRLLCIFPFEEAYFRSRGVPATYIGHPLVGMLQPRTSRAEFFRKHRLAAERPLIGLLPGSRQGEAARHMPELLGTVQKLSAWRAMNFVLAASPTAGKEFFLQRTAGTEIRIVEGETPELLAHANLALVASGTATVEAALLGTPMITFYKVHPLSWTLGRWAVRTPYYSMVNILAGQRVVPELMQADCNPSELFAEVRRLLDSPEEMAQMRHELQAVRDSLAGSERAIERAVSTIQELLAATNPRAGLGRDSSLKTAPAEEGACDPAASHCAPGVHAPETTVGAPGVRIP